MNQFLLNSSQYCLALSFGIGSCPRAQTDQKGTGIDCRYRLVAVVDLR